MNILTKMQTDTLSCLDLFTPLTLEEIHDVRLMDRIDTKYVAPLSLLPTLLEEMRPYFRVQEHNDRRIASYSTQYLDTQELSMFLMHHNGKLNRQKIRIRTYLDSNDAFLEVKNKNNKGRTKKIRVPFPHSHIDNLEELGEQRPFLDSHCLFPTASLVPCLSNDFNRITFVNNRMSERITVDFNLRFLNHRTEGQHTLHDFIILELKQDGWKHSDFKDILLRLRIKRRPFSKYCMGTILTDSAIKSNNFKRRIYLLNKYNQYDSVRL